MIFKKGDKVFCVNLYQEGIFLEYTSGIAAKVQFGKDDIREIFIKDLQKQPTKEELKQLIEKYNDPKQNNC